ncbi:bifunctional biotin--[acetyl-CoA-carboxylase] ligase/biotin operon repressor BirA [Aestuariibacter sp. GS-14]|uniref:bifunctional biotin--[acetyl-CoA-carboxylase] ligase/biotin operon repressor BirA n=1 Tax=Aestuariibacter sp. GS-14 TaxID=2590670 RepID=UPI00112CA674|nr:bifunctional biotin--[acetyl-CoA-carboxylase] ligase/biotin operon repressor BirA [Aestuariibacter sp. GS-14]TPV58295.1 bifunctional biotin--[acetyl-CoA-carboxylase] ligase/biotin operon repressor BirA [Aestuariibacter sp. GS-14]
MKPKAREVRQTLLSTLADGEFHSGETLAQTLGLSRTAIAGHITQLTGWGLDVFKVKGKGYKLNRPFILLDEAQITQRIQMPLKGKVRVAQVIESTNTELKEGSTPRANGDVILAEIQTAGRGRHGRQWLAPVGGSLTMSMYWRFNDGYQSMAGLSLLVGIAVCQALKDCGLDDARLKWPNDVYLYGKKLAGVLIEVEGQLGAPADSIIGIGLNVTVPENEFDVGQPHIDMSQVLGAEINRNDVAARIIEQLWTLLPAFTQRGFEPFVSDWQELDWFADRTVVIKAGNKRISGINRGIDASGALLLETSDGITRFHGGEVSLRAG